MPFTELLLEIVSQAYNLTLLAAALYALACFRRVDRATRYICLLIGLGAVSESAAWYAAVRFRNNMPVYAISSMIEFTITCLYFNYSLRYYKQRHIGVIVALLGILFGIGNIVCFQPLHTINSNFLFFECLGVVCLSLFSIYKRLMATDLRLLKETHYWLPHILLFYKCTALWNWGLYDYVLEHYPENIIYLNIAILLINVVTYLSFALMLFFYPKMRRTYV